VLGVNFFQKVTVGKRLPLLLKPEGGGSIVDLEINNVVLLRLIIVCCSGVTGDA
jgi:hypothetical protein